MSGSEKPPVSPDEGGEQAAPGTPDASALTPARISALAAAAVVVLTVAGVVTWLVLTGTDDSASVSSHTSSASSSAGTPVQGLTGDAVRRVLLDGADLTTLLDQPFTATTPEPISGGFDEMENPPIPGDCVGVINVAPQPVYRSADVQSYAHETWSDATPRRKGPHRTDTGRFTTKVMFVEESVVALPSAADAQALFAKFSEQWKRCDGQPVDHADAGSSPHLPGTEMHITDVRTTDDVLAASIVFNESPRAPDTRAVGVRGNCIVGVLIAFTGAENGAGKGDPHTSSIAAVQAMMEKVNELS